MSFKTQGVPATLAASKLWLPMLIGIGVVAYLFVHDEGFSVSQVQLLGQANWYYLCLALLAVLVRDLSCMYRMRIVTHSHLTWSSSFYVVLLGEFAAAMTPFSAGGGAVAAFVLLREGIRGGKALAYVMLPSLFDSLFFLGAASLGFWGMYDAIFALESQLGSNLRVLFWSSYVGVCIYVLTFVIALCFHPQLFKWVLYKLTSNRFLMRWRPIACSYGDDMIAVFKVLRSAPLTHWLHVGSISLLIWLTRYLIVNLIITAYVPLDLGAHFMIFGKQLIAWPALLVSPTPGGSGTAEFFYKRLHEAMLGDYTLVTIIIWRTLTFYVYLLLGAVYTPRWIKHTYLTNQETTSSQS